MKIKKFKNIVEKIEFNIQNNIEFGLYGKYDDNSYWLLQKFNTLKYAIGYYKKSVIEKNGGFIYDINIILKCIQ